MVGPWKSQNAFTEKCVDLFLLLLIFGFVLVIIYLFIYCNKGYADIGL